MRDWAYLLSSVILEEVHPQLCRGSVLSRGVEDGGLHADPEVAVEWSQISAGSRNA
jgi:hypothetical protein